MNVQNQFIDMLCKNETPTTVFLVNGVKLQGKITFHDAYTVLLRRESHSQLIYKHAISTVMPNEPVAFVLEEESQQPKARSA